MKLSILGARVIDPASGLDQVTDIHIEACKIIALGAAPAGLSPSIPSTPKAWSPPLGWLT